MVLSTQKKFLYAFGQFGLVLCAYGVGNFFVSFYVSRGFSGSVVFPTFLDQGYLFGFFTVTGLIIALAKLVDAAMGLFSGYGSDRSRVKRGRRTGFMALAALPTALFSVLVFVPPVIGSSPVNAVFVLVVTILFYVFLSLYTIPYLALLSGCSNSSGDRLKITMMMAFATAIASLFGDRLSFVVDWIFSFGRLSHLSSFRLALLSYAVVSLVCMLIPSILIGERKYSEEEPDPGTFSVSFGAVVRDNRFRPYLLADMLYRIASAFAIAGFTFYVTVLLDLPMSFTVYYLLLIFFANIAFYAPVAALAQRAGKRAMLFAAFLMLIVFLTLSIFAGQYPLPSVIQGAILSLLIAIPLSIFTVIPNAIVADFAVAAEKKTGAHRAGMYFGVHSLVMKMGQLFSTLLFPSVMAIGTGNYAKPSQTGLRVTLILAAAFSLVGFFALFGYREREVSALLERK